MEKINNMEKILEKLDTFLNLRNKREKNIIFLLPIVLFGYLSYSYVTPAQIKTNKKFANDLRSMKSEMSTYQEMVSEKTSESKKINEGNHLKQEIAKIKDISMYADAKLKSLDFIYLDSSSWSKYLNKIVTNATKNNIKMSDFTNNKISKDNNNSEFRRVLSVEFNAEGSFHNMYSFLYDIENNVFITNIDKFTLKGGDKITATFSTSLWGIEQ